MCRGALPLTERPDQTPAPASVPRGVRALLVLVVTAVITSFGFSVTALSPVLGQGSRAVATSPTTSTVKVWFLQGEQLVPATRSGSTPEDAVQALLKGPTSAEYRLGYRTYIPAGTDLRTVTVANGLVTVDLSLPFALGNNAAEP